MEMVCFSGSASLFQVTMPARETKLLRILFKTAVDEYDLVIVQ